MHPIINIIELKANGLESIIRGFFDVEEARLFFKDHCMEIGNEIKVKKNAKEVEVFIAEDLPVKEELPTDQTGEEVTEVESTTESVVEEKE